MLSAEKSIDTNVYETTQKEITEWVRSSSSTVSCGETNLVSISLSLLIQTLGAYPREANAHVSDSATRRRAWAAYVETILVQRSPLARHCDCPAATRYFLYSTSTSTERYSPYRPIISRWRLLLHENGRTIDE